MKMFLTRLLDDYVCITLKRGRKIFLAILICFTAGFILGLITGGGVYNGFIFEDSVKFTVQMYKGEISFFAIIIRGVFINVRYFLLVYIFSLCVFLIPLNFLFLAFKGYVFGAAVIVFTGALGVHGFACLLIIVLPQQFLLMFALSLYIAASSPVTVCYKKSFVCYGMHFKTCAVYFILSLCNIIVELLLLYVIIKPFNILI